MNGLNYKFLTLSDALENSCLEEEHFISFIAGESEEVRISYGCLRRKALEFLAGLQSIGISAGDEVILHLDDNLNFLYIFWACILGGIIPVPVAMGNSDEHRMKLLKIWNVLKKPFLICNEEVAEKLELFSKENGLEGEMREIAGRLASVDEVDGRGEPGRVFEASPGDIAFIQFSSGSTGDPKGVVLTHENLTTNIKAILKGIACTEKDSTLSWMPLTHDMGLIGFHLSVLAANINQYIMPTSLFIKRPILWMQKACEHKVSILSSPNFGLKYFMTHHNPEVLKNLDLSGIRIIFNGAEPICADICREFLDRMEPYHLKRNVMFNVFGMAEASLAVSFPPIGEGLVAYDLDRNGLSIGDTARASCDGHSSSITLVDLGSAVQDCFIRICGQDGTVSGDNTIGHIQIRGKNVTSGYYNSPEATKQALTDDGWLKTGDIGFLRNHRLVVAGRAKDIIFINGQNYYPHDIENACSGLEGADLGRAAACGLFNERSGTEEVIVFILYKKSIQSFIPLASEVKKRIGKKMGVEVSRVIPVGEIPKTTSGKIRRYKLGDDYRNGRFSDVLAELDKLISEKGGDPPFPQYDPIVVKVLEIVGDVLGKRDIGAQDDFFELGVDSIKALQIVSRLNEEGIRIEVNDILNYHSVYEVCSHWDFDKGRIGKDTAGTPGRMTEKTEGVQKTCAVSEQPYLVRLRREELDELFE